MKKLKSGANTYPGGRMTKKTIAKILCKHGSMEAQQRKELQATGEWLSAWLSGT